MTTEFEYYENVDGTFFRRRANSGLISVDDVWTPSGWQPFKGDRFKQGYWSNRVDWSQLPEAARTEPRGGGCGGALR